GLPGAVRTDQPVDLAARNRKADVGERLDAPEPLRDAERFEQHAHGRRSASSRLRTADGHKPPGRSAMTSTSANPKISMRITSGSMIIRPKSCFCACLTVNRRVSGTKESSGEPRITPQTIPMA